VIEAAGGDGGLTIIGTVIGDETGVAAGKIGACVGFAMGYEIAGLRPYLFARGWGHLAFSLCAQDAGACVSTG
jgi:hypothetical protein